MNATYLINKMPSRVLRMKTLYEIIYGKNESIVPNHRPLVGKLNPRAVKCIFTGYRSASSLDNHMDKKGTSVGVLMRGEHL
jgi:hypothetical protein